MDRRKIYNTNYTIDKNGVVYDKEGSEVAPQKDGWIKLGKNKYKLHLCLTDHFGERELANFLKAQNPKRLVLYPDYAVTEDRKVYSLLTKEVVQESEGQVLMLNKESEKFSVSVEWAYQSRFREINKQREIEELIKNAERCKNHANIIRTPEHVYYSLNPFKKLKTKNGNLIYPLGPNHVQFISLQNLKF